MMKPNVAALNVPKNLHNSRTKIKFLTKTKKRLVNEEKLINQVNHAMNS